MFKATALLAFLYFSDFTLAGDIYFRDMQAFLPFNASHNPVFTTTVNFGTIINAYPVTLNSKRARPTFRPDARGTGRLGVMAKHMVAYQRNDVRYGSSDRLTLNYPGNFNMKAVLPPQLKFDDGAKNMTIIVDASDVEGDGAIIVVQDDDVGNNFQGSFPLVMEEYDPEGFIEYTGRIDYGNDVDVFMVGWLDNSTYPQPRTVYFWSLARNGDITDTVGTLFDYSGSVTLASDDDSNGNHQFLMQKVLNPNTPYFVQIKCWASWNVGDYVFRYAFAPPAQASSFSRQDYYATETAITFFPRFTKACSGTCPTQIGEEVVDMYCFPTESCPNPSPSVTQACNEMCRGYERTQVNTKPSLSAAPTSAKGTVVHTRVFGDTLSNSAIGGFNMSSFGLFMGLFALVGIVVGIVIYYRSGGFEDAKQGLYGLPPEATFMPMTQHTMLNGQSVYGGGMDGSMGMSVYGGGMSVYNPAMMNMSVYGGGMNPAMMNMSVYGAPNPGMMNMSVYGAPMQLPTMTQQPQESTTGSPTNVAAKPEKQDTEKLLSDN